MFNNKRKIIGFIIGLIFFSITITSLTYAYYAWNSTNTNVTFNVDDEYFYCETDINSGVSNLSPVIDYKDGVLHKFKVNNVGNKDTTFSITMNIDSIDEALKHESFKYKLMVDKTNGNNDCSAGATGCEEVANGNFKDVHVGNNNLVPSITLPNNSRYEYYFFMYIDGNVSNPTEMQTASMVSTLGVCDIYVTFDTSVGDTTVSPMYKKVVEGEKYGTLPTPTRNNAIVTYNTNGGNTIENDTVSFTFNGWYKEQTFTNAVTSDTTITLSVNHTLYPKWTSSKTITLPTPTKEGYTFNGWYSDSELINKVGDAGDSYNPEKSLTLYAKWNPNIYKVNLSGNGVTNNGTTVIYEKYGVGWYSDSAATNKITSITVPTRDGYTFSGYYGYEDGSGTNFINASGNIIANNNVTTLNNLTIYAKWEGNNITITYDNNYNLQTNNGTNGLNGTSWQNNELVFDGVDDYVDLGIMNLNTFTFSLKFKTSNISREQYIVSNKYNGGIAVSITNSKICGRILTSDNSVNWKMICADDVTITNNTYYEVSLTYDGNNLKLYLNNTLQTSLNVSYDIVYTYSSPSMLLGCSPSENGCTSNTFFVGNIQYIKIYNRALSLEEINSDNVFNGLIKNISGTNHSIMGSLKNINEYKIYKKYESTSTLSPPDQIVPKRLGYTFDGWYTESSGGERVTDTTPLPTTNKTYYAHWVAGTYKVYYLGNGGTNLANNRVVSKYSGLYNGSKNIHLSSTSTWYDMTGNGHNGTISNATISSNNIQFNGTDSWVNLGNLNSSFTDSITMKVIFLVKNSLVNNGVIIGNYNNGGCSLKINQGVLIGTCRINNIDYNVEKNISSGIIYSAVLTYSKTNGILSLYVNGEVADTQNTGNYSITSPTNNTVMAVGCKSNASSCSSGYFTGNVYEISLLNNALTLSEIQNDTYKEVTFGSTYGQLPTPSKVGYSFLNWYLDKSLTELVNSSTTVSYGRDNYIYASWGGLIYKVNLNGNGVTNNGTTTIYEHYGIGWFSDSEVNNKITSVTIPTRDGYTFGGYYGYADGSGTNFIKANGEINYPSGTATTINNLTIYAKWTANAYTINYNLNGGTSGTYAPTSGTYDTYVRISNPTKTIRITGNVNNTGATVGSSTSKAQTFSGWTSTTIGSNAKTGTSTNPTTTWTGTSTKNEYFKNLVGSGTVTMVANWSPVAVPLPTLSKTGHTCKWYTDATGGSEMGSGGASWSPTSTTEASVTAYARCTPIKYTVNVVVNEGTITGDVSKEADYGTSPTFTVSPTEPLSTGTVTCTNSQTATLDNNTLTINNITNNTTCTVTFTSAVTTLYTDGTLIINEKLSDRASNINTHGAVTNEYEALSNTNAYVWNSASNQLWKNERNSILSVEIGKNIQPTSTRYWFYNLRNMSSGDFTNLDTSKTTDMYSMFYSAGYNNSVTSFTLTGLDNLNTSNVTSMSSMFYSAGYKATTWSIGDLSDWNTSSVTSMSSMFSSAGYSATTWSIGDLSDWDVSSVRDVSYMFSSAGRNTTTWNIGTLSGWNTSSVTNMSSIFSSAGYSATTWNIGDLSGWNTSSVTNMSHMFSYAGYKATTWNIGDLSSWDVSKVTTMYYMFYNAGYSATTFDIGNLLDWDVSSVTSMSSMFYNAGYKATTWNIGDLSDWDVSSVTNMFSMFSDAGRNATTFDIGDLSGWDVSSVTNMSSMFDYAGYKATTWNIGNLSDWDVSKVTTMYYMFSGAGYSATTFDIGNLSDWDTSNVITMSYMFLTTGRNATTWNIGDLSDWDVSSVTNMSFMFSGAGEKATTFDIGDLSDWDVSSVTDMSSMFSSAGRNTTTWNIGTLSDWDTSNVTNMSSMFYYAGYKTTTWTIGDLSDWDTSKVTNMSSMFYYAGYNAITWNIGDLSGWNTSSVTNMSSMFSSAGEKATTWTIGDLSSWDVSKVTTMYYMFYNAGYSATTFDIGDLSGWDVSSVTSMSSMFYSAGYKATTWNIGNLSNWDTSKVTNMSSMFYDAGFNATTWNSIGTLKVYATNIQDMFRYCIYCKATLNIYSNPTSYSSAFAFAATESGALITVNYSSSTSNIDNIIATKSSYSNVVKGSLLS